MCTHFKTSNVTSMYSALIHSTQQKVIFYTNVATLDDFKAFLVQQYTNGTAVEIVYELSTPVIEDIECSNKIMQYDEETTIYNRDEAEIEVSLTNNKAISEVNEDIDNMERRLRDITTYSTKEQKIGKWIDGRPIYRKVISGNMPVPDVNGGTWYNIANNVHNLVNVYGNILQRPYNYILISRSGSYCPAFDVVVDSNILKYRNLGVPADYSYKITLEYTKIED